MLVTFSLLISNVSTRKLQLKLMLDINSSDIFEKHLQNIVFIEIYVSKNMKSRFI